jgi:uncharacterized protein YqgV (UPF0045/DUF77 family)
MMVSAQVAVYPLRQERLTPAITAVSDALQAAGLQPEMAAMSTTVTGDAAVVFAALRDGFLAAGGVGHVVMTVTISNACLVSR